MKILPLHPEIKEYLEKRNLERKFEKQKQLFENNPFHPSLNTELLGPRKMKIWSFKIDHKYRAIFLFREKDIIEVIDVNNHYQWITKSKYGRLREIVEAEII